MFELIEADDVINEIIFLKQTHQGSFLIVEGRSDQKTLFEYIDRDECSIVVAGGKCKALDAIRMLDDDGFEGILCIVDSDFQKADYQSDNLITTDCHDMDIVIFESDALGRFLRHQADYSKLTAFEKDTGLSFKEIIYRAAMPLSCLRALSQNCNLQLNFQNLRFDFVQMSNLSVNVDLMLESIRNCSKGEHNQSDLKDRLNIISRQGHPLRKLCHGHDVMEITGISLIHCIADIRNKNTGNRDSRTWRSEIEKMMRMAFHKEDFLNSSICKNILEWERDNKKFKILVN